MNDAVFSECLCMHHSLMDMMRPRDIINSDDFIIVSMMSSRNFLVLPFDIMTSHFGERWKD